MKKNRKYVLTDTILKEIAQKAEDQLIDEMMEREDALEHTWTKGRDDVLKRAAREAQKKTPQWNPRQKRDHGNPMYYILPPVHRVEVYCLLYKNARLY